MPRPTIIRRGGVIVIPQDVSQPNWKILIDSEDVSDFIVDGIVILTATKATGAFNLTLDNDLGRYKGKWDGNETIEIYADYSTAANKIFQGSIESIRYQFSSRGRFVRLSGRQAPNACDQTRILSWGGTAARDMAINALRGTAGTADSEGNYPDGAMYETGLTWDTDNDNFYNMITASYINKPKWDIIKDIVRRCSCDCYITPTLTLRMFTSESITNSDESITVADNLIGLDVGTDTRYVKNRIHIYGANAEDSTNVVYLKTANDTDSQDDYGRHDLIISDPDVNSMDELDDKATVELANNKDLNKQGNITSIGLPKLNPGEMFYVTSPRDNIDKGLFKAVEIRHTLSKRDGFRTIVSVDERRKNTPMIFQDRIEKERSLVTFNNINEMEDSYVITFEESPSLCTHSDTKELNSYLVLDSGYTTGTCTINKKTFGANVGSFELRLEGSNLAVSSFKVSNDNGISWITAVQKDREYTFASTGKDVKIEITLLSDDDNPYPVIQTIGVMVQQ